MELLLLIALVVYFIGVAVERLIGAKNIGVIIGIAAAIAGFVYFVDLIKLV